MDTKELIEQPQFLELLKSIPETEREKILNAVKEMVTEFNEKILKPLEHAKR